MRLHEQDEIISNFESYNDIDDRQAQALLLLLEKWKNNDIQPQDVLLEMMQIMNAVIFPMLNYSIARNANPESEYYKNILEAVEIDARNALKNMDEKSAKILGYTIQNIKNPSKKDAGPAKKPDPEKLLARYKKTLEKLWAESPEFKTPLKINDDIQGSCDYVDAVQELIRLRDGLLAEGNTLDATMAECTLVTNRAYRKEVIYNVGHIEELRAKAADRMTAEWQRSLDCTLAHIRPEMFDPAKKDYIGANINVIYGKLERASFDSWKAAYAIAEILIIPDNPEASYSDKWRKSFFDKLKEAEERANKKKPDVETTLKAFTPITEAETRRKLAYEFDFTRQFQAYRAMEIAEYKDKNNGKDPGADFSNDLDHFRQWTYEKPDEVAYKSTIACPDRVLCNKITIDPSGTALINLQDPNIYSEPYEDQIYGVSAGRITTYALNFTVLSPDDIEPMKDVIKQALEIIATSPYAFPLNDLGGEGYERPMPSAGKWRWNGKQLVPRLDVRDYTISLNLRLDLDDVWLLYYLLEPVLEPCAQIAAAMNAARYNEERGAVLNPSEAYIYNRQHEVADPAASLVNDNETDPLASRAWDAIVDLALNKIDRAQFMMRYVALANHTLTKRIPDLHGAFPSYDKMIADQRTEGKNAIMSFDEALEVRLRDLLGTVLSVPKGMSFDTALTILLGKISKPLRAEFAKQTKQRREDEEAFLARSLHEPSNWSFIEMFKRNGITLDPDEEEDYFSAHNMATRLSDVFAGRAGKTDEEINKAHKTALANRNALVLADSRVEQAIDGIFAQGRYRTRAKGSPLPRYEMPLKLAPFTPEGKRSRTALLTSVLSI